MPGKKLCARTSLFQGGESWYGEGVAKKSFVKQLLTPSHVHTPTTYPALALLGAGAECGPEQVLQGRIGPIPDGAELIHGRLRGFRRPGL